MAPSRLCGFHAMARHAYGWLLLLQFRKGQARSQVPSNGDSVTRTPAAASMRTSWTGKGGPLTSMPSYSDAEDVLLLTSDDLLLLAADV